MTNSWKANEPLSTRGIIGTCAASAALLALTGCVGDVGGIDVEAERQISVRFDNRAICQVRVAGYGTVDVETEYIPRVVWCEVGDMPKEALKAQAIAARTFMYRLMSIRRGSNRYMRNGTDDQVYRLSRCNGRIPQLYRDVAKETAGIVMVKSNGHLHHGYYRGDGRSSCSPRANCFGEPCLSQHGARTCARSGWSYTKILDMFYQRPQLIAASPTCSSVAGKGPTPTSSCAHAGGSCQSSSSCNGRFHDGLACSSGKRCCLPKQDDTYGPCNHGGATGVCQDQTQTDCHGRYQSGLCPGNRNVRCCLPATGSSYGSCSYRGVGGVCQDQTQTTCQGSYQSGLCPGNQNVRCCLPPSSPWGSCKHNGVTGVCQDKTKTDCHGRYQSGLCPGNNNIKCCLPN
jgi:hypothetical protein